MVGICVTEIFTPTYALILQISLKGTCCSIIGSLLNASPSNIYRSYDIARKFTELRFLMQQGLEISEIMGKNCAIISFINSFFGEIDQIRWVPERLLLPRTLGHKEGRP